MAERASDLHLASVRLRDCEVRNGRGEIVYAVPRERANQSLTHLRASFPAQAFTLAQLADVDKLITLDDATLSRGVAARRAYVAMVGQQRAVGKSYFPWTDADECAALLAAIGAIVGPIDGASE